MALANKLSKGNRSRDNLMEEGIGDEVLLRRLYSLQNWMERGSNLLLNNKGGVTSCRW